jgi:hypothetical protein
MATYELSSSSSSIIKEIKIVRHKILSRAAKKEKKKKRNVMLCMCYYFGMQRNPRGWPKGKKRKNQPEIPGPRAPMTG